MQTPGRAMPHVALGVLTLLALVAIIVSLDTAPPNAQEQLNLAADNTVAASSFALNDTNTVTPVGGATSSTNAKQGNVVDIVYQAPDRVSETLVGAAGQTVTLLVIGNARYERSGTSKWVSYAGTPGSGSPGLQAAADVLFPLRSLAGATDVVRHGNTFTFIPGQLDQVLVSLLGSQPAQLAPRTMTFRATVEGEFVTFEQVEAVRNGHRLTVRLKLSQVTGAPALEAPPRSQILEAPATTTTPRPG
ncbi:MAG: hypothetical protein ACYDD6_04695 [Acidimicrobiales bacterium]